MRQVFRRPMGMTSMISPEHSMIAAALDAVAADTRATDGARERMTVALAASRMAEAVPAVLGAFDASVLCLDRDVAESYSFEEAREAADLRRRPRRDLLAAGLEKPSKKKPPTKK